MGRSGCALRKTSTVADEDDVEHLILDMTTRFLDEDEVARWLQKRLYRSGR